MSWNALGLENSKVDEVVSQLVDIRILLVDMRILLTEIRDELIKQNDGACMDEIFRWTKQIVEDNRAEHNRLYHNQGK